MNLSELEIRSNGQTVKVDASWWNDIRLVLLGLFGAGVTAEEQVTIANGAGATNISTLLFDSAEYVAATVEYSALRQTDSEGRRTKGRLDILYHPTTGWDLAPTEVGDISGITFAINTSTGQVSYTSDTISGSSYVGKMRFKVTSTFAVEV